MTSFRKENEKTKNIPSALKKIQKMDASMERRVLVASIVSDSYCSAIFKNKNQIHNLLPAESSKMIWQFALSFYDQWNCAVRGSLRNVFEDESKEMSKEISDDIEDLLIGISKQYSNDDFQWEYEFEQTKKYIDERHLEENLKEAQALLDLGKAEEAQALKLAFNPIDWEEDEHEFDPFRDSDMMSKSINEAVTPIVNLRGGLGQFMNRELTRGSYVAILAAEKSGKTFTLMDVAIQAINQGLNVAFVGLGDMSDTQMTKRLLSMVTKQPSELNHCGERLIPTLDCAWNQDGSCSHKCTESILFEDEETGEIERLVYEDLEDDYTPCTACKNDKKLSDRVGKGFKGAIWKEKVFFGSEFCGDLVGLNLAQAQLEVAKMMRRGKKGDYRFYAYSTASKSVGDIDRILREEQKKTGFKPDLIIADYSDLFKAEDGVSMADERAMCNARYTKCRSMALEWDACFLTAFQANSNTYKKLMLDRGSFSLDRRILSHATAVFGLVKTPKDHELSSSRMGLILARNTMFTDEQVVILQDLGSGQYHIDSYVASLEELKENHPAYIDKEQRERDERTDSR